MNYWHMRLYPGRKLPKEEKEKYTKQALDAGVIGLDWGCGDLDPNTMEVYEKLKNKLVCEFNEEEKELFRELIHNENCGFPGEKESAIFGHFEYFCKEMKEGDIVLITIPVEEGSKPVALVRITSGPFFVSPETDEVWFSHRRKVEILYSWPEDTSDRCSLRRAPTVMPLTNKNTNPYKIIERKLKEINILKKLESLVKILKCQKQIILYGPPGTGKTYLAKQIAAKMLGLEPEAGVNEKHPENKDFQKAHLGSTEEPSKAKGKWALVQFHPSYHYEDFVRGIEVKAQGSGVLYEVADRIFVQMCNEAKNWCDSNCPDKEREECQRDECVKYILIIDEINRANLAAVLGELIYALEYRDEPVRLPYGDDYLKIPPNLYIIGTMNTADRSIGHIDYAVRRRFAFVQVLPDEEVITQYYQDKNENLGKAALNLFKAVEKLFDKDDCLSPDYHKEDVQPGHSYFLAEDIEELAFKFAYQVWPLLKEYCKDGVFLCENCTIELNGQSFPLKDNITPEKILETVRGLISNFEEKSDENAKETDETE